MFFPGFDSKLTSSSPEDLSCWLDTFATHNTTFGLMPQCGVVMPASEVIALTIAINDQSITQSIQKLLQLAQRQLQVSQIPSSIKIALYLKICCLAIQKSFMAEQPIPAERLYHNLMQWLSECEPEWWQQCSITARGITSHNARIQDLLQPLTDFAQQFLEA